MKKGCLCQDPFFFLILKFTYLFIPFLFLALKEQYTYISGMAQTLLECGKKKTTQKQTEYRAWQLNVFPVGHNTVDPLGFYYVLLSLS